MRHHHPPPFFKSSNLKFKLGENIIDGFGNLFTIVENTVQNVQSEMNMTSSWRNLTTIVNIQQHAFQQASYNEKHSNKKRKKTFRNLFFI